MKPNSPIMRYLLQNNLVDDFVPYGVYMRYVAGLSFFNSATLMVQRRGVGYAATETTWLKRFGRVIKPGANPLIIMKPFAPLDLFYEACDTYSPDGEPLPEWIAEKLANVPPVPTKPFAFDHAAAVQVLNNHGVYYDEREMGERAGGIIKYTEAPIFLKELGVYTNPLCDGCECQEITGGKSSCNLPRDRAPALRSFAAG